MHNKEKTYSSDTDKSWSEFIAGQYKGALLLSDHFLEEHKYSDVEKVLASAIRMCPEQALGYAKLGEFYLEYGGKKSDALWCLNKAQQLDPLNVENLLNLCSFYELVGRFKEAREIGEKILELAPDNHRSLVILGCHYANDGQYNKALQFLEKATKIDSSNEAAWFNLSILHHKQGNIQEELKCLEHAIGINPFCFEYWCQLGFSYKSLGEFDECLECFWRANKIAIFDPSIIFEIAVVHAIKKEKETTLDILKLVRDDDFPLHDEILKEEAFNFLKSDKDFQLLLASLSA